VLPVEITARLMNVASMVFVSTVFGARTSGVDSTIKGSAVIAALGASGKSLAAEIPPSTNTAKIDNKVVFKKSPLTAIDSEAPALCFPLATDLLRSVMKRDYVRPCTRAIARTC